MAKDILIIGPSGSGKSTSYRNLDPNETFIFNVSKKPLPFKGSMTKYNEFDPSTKTGNMFSSNNYASILKVLQWLKGQTQFKNIILDDSNYIMQQEYIKRAYENGYQKFTEIGVHYAEIINLGKSFNNDVLFVVSVHPEYFTNIDGEVSVKSKTVGKLVDNYLTVEGMFTIVLYANPESSEDGTQKNYVFETQSLNGTPSKSPMGMLEVKEPNDLKVIKDKINKYYK